MKNNLTIIKLGIASFLLCFAVAARPQATATGHISAEVVDAITAFESTPMNFGRLATGDEGGAIVIDPASGRVVATSAILAGDDEVSPATFTVSGVADATFSVTLPQSPAMLTNSEGFGELSVSGWTASPGDGGESFVLAGGKQTVRIGARLEVGSANDTPKGKYTGSYEVTFAYN